MFSCSPKDNLICIRLILNKVLLPEWSTAVFFCLVMVVHESLCLSWTVKLPAVLREKSFSSHRFFGFTAFLCIWTLSNNDYDFEIHLFSPRTTEGLICNYYRRFKHSLMLKKKRKIYTSSFCSKVFALNAWFFLLEHQWVTSCNLFSLVDYM